MTEHLHKSFEGGVLTLRLTRPEKKNALTRAMYDGLAQGLRVALTEMDRWEVNLLLQPHGGVLEKGEPLVELVKKVGGFRIGALPSFQHAFESGRMTDTLRKLAPYAQAVSHILEN